MNTVTEYPLTRQGVRDLDNPIHRQVSRVNVGSVERTMSTLGAAVLAGIGLANRGLPGLLLIAAGGALAYRGVTGHCPLYTAAGVNSAR